MRKLLAYLLDAPQGRLYQKGWEEVVEETVHALIKVRAVVMTCRDSILMYGNYPHLIDIGATVVPRRASDRHTYM